MAAFSVSSWSFRSFSWISFSCSCSVWQQTQTCLHNQPNNVSLLHVMELIWTECSVFTTLSLSGVTPCLRPVYLFDSSLVFGGPSLLAVVQLLQVALQVDHLLLREEEFRKNKSSCRQPNSASLRLIWGHTSWWRLLSHSGYVEMGKNEASSRYKHNEYLGL